MSRHRGVKKIIDEALDDEEMDDDYGDDYELTEDDYAFADEIWDALERKCTQDEVIAVLNRVDWDGDKAFEILQKEIKNKKDQPKKPVETKQTQETQKPKVNESKSKTESNTTGRERIMSEEEAKLEFKSEPASINNSYVDKSKFNQIYPPIKYKTEAKNLDILNVAVTGHVDSGKSTLVGQLLCLAGEVDKSSMHKIEKESQHAGKTASKLAWMLDEREEERLRGITIDVGMKRIHTKKRTIVFLDCPGHKDFVDNMMVGAAQADLGVLVIDVIKNAFESGFSQGGQTKEHGLILRAMGIPKVLVVYNKMDYVNWNQERYQYSSSLINTYLQEIGFDEDDIYEVPISGLQGQNVYTRYKDPCAEWYEGATLMEILENIVVSRPAVNKPLRMNISSCYYASTGKVKGHCITGKIAAGVLEKNTKYVIMPYGVEVTVKDILCDEEKPEVAHVGETPTLSLKIKEQDFGHLGNGHLLCDPKYPAPVAKKFQAIIEIYDYEYPLIKGERVNLHINLVKCSALISKIIALLDKKTGEPTKKNPRCLLSGQMAKVEITCERPVCLELFENYPTYGRFTVREKGESIASGKITEIIE